MPGYTPPASVQNINYASYGQPLADPSNTRLYGSMPLEEEHGSGAPLKDGLVHLSLHPDGGRRARIDPCQILLNIVMPVAIFAIPAAVLSFKLHYDLWILAWTIAICCAIPGLYVGSLSKQAFNNNEKITGKWLLLLCCLCLLAWVLSLIVGAMNYSTNMLRYYEMTGLNYYPSVDPSASGQSHIDAGRVLFQAGSRVDLTRAMGVHISSTYCVAPVVTPTGANEEYDYWAVGMNCCSSVQPQSKWTCGEINNPSAGGGMRLMTDAERPFYRMAVQEAEATYKIKAKNPIYFDWMQDPAAKMTSWREAGTRTYFESLFSVTVLMFFLSCAAGIYFSRAAMESHPCQGTGFRKYVGENPEHDFLAEEGWEKASGRASGRGSVKSLTV